MESIKEILTSIFARIDVKHKWQRNFLFELFDLVFCVKGRLTFENMARYCHLHESTFRPNDALTIVLYYQLRFKIEFLFRDAKQFTGLTHCQARCEDKLDFHFNMSMAALNLAQLHLHLNETHKSMNSFVRKAYNNRLTNFLFSQLSFKPELDLNHPAVISALHFGCLRA